MVEHDGHVGKLLDKLDELGIADNTIVMYSTDNGAEVMSWPDGGTTPFRGEKDTNYEGGWRVPCAIRWPGVIEPGTVSNELFSHTDMLPTLAAAAGEPDSVDDQAVVLVSAKGLEEGDVVWQEVGAEFVGVGTTGVPVEFGLQRIPTHLEQRLRLAGQRSGAQL